MTTLPAPSEPAPKKRKGLNRSQKGSYYVKRTMEWLVLEGFEAVKLEDTKRIYRGNDFYGKPQFVFTKRDIWGADIMARSEEKLAFIQVKANRKDILAGLKQLAGGVWPPFIDRWVVHWPKGRRLEEGPEIEVVG